MLTTKEKESYINKAFDNGFFQTLFHCKGILPKRVRAQIFPYQNKEYLIILHSPVDRLKDIKIVSALDNGEITIIPIDQIKDIKSVKIFGTNGFSFSSDKKLYKFISKRNADTWVFYLKNPDKPATFIL